MAEHLVFQEVVGSSPTKHRNSVTYPVLLKEEKWATK